MLTPFVLVGPDGVPEVFLSTFPFAFFERSLAFAFVVDERSSIVKPLIVPSPSPAAAAAPDAVMALDFRFKFLISQ